MRYTGQPICRVPVSSQHVQVVPGPKSPLGPSNDKPRLLPSPLSLPLSYLPFPRLSPSEAPPLPHLNSILLDSARPPGDRPSGRSYQVPVPRLIGGPISSFENASSPGRHKRQLRQRPCFSRLFRLWSSCLSLSLSSAVNPLR